MADAVTVIHRPAYLPYSGIDRFSLGARLTAARAVNGRLIHDGALGFTYAAAVAEFGVHYGSVHGERCSVGQAESGFHHQDRFGRGRTSLFADAARFAQRVGQAAVFFDPGHANPGSQLFFDRQLLDRAGRTDLGAERAVVFAISDSGHENGRPDPEETGLTERVLQAVGRANLHALAALDALGQELRLGQRARGANELFRGPLRARQADKAER